MPKISKKLTNAIYISGKSEEIQEFIKRVKEKRVKIVSVRFPKKLEDLESITKFIDSSWKVAKMDLKNKILYARPKSGEAYIVFADDELEYLLLEEAEKLKLCIRYKYLLSDKKKSYIATEENKNGDLELNDKVEKINSDEYTIANCLI